MATRTHLCVALLLSSSTGLIASGCIFGGGHKAKKSAPLPQAVVAPREPQQPIAAVATPAPGKQKASKQAVDDAVARALKPQDSAVQWPTTDELGIGHAKPERAAVPPAAQADAAQPRVAVHQPKPQIIAPAPDPAPEPTALAEPEPAPAPSSDIVSNEPMDLKGTGAAATTTTPPPAAQHASASVKANIGDPAGAALIASTDPIGGRVEQRLRENPGDLPAHFDHQLLRFLADEPAPDLAALSSLPSEDRELLTAVIDGLSNFRNNLRVDHNMLHSKKVRPLLDMAARLRSQSELWIPTIALCDHVKGFGVYEPINAQFLAGTAREVLVYCEVANFAAQQSDQGTWEVKLSQEAVLYKENGQRVWYNRKETTVDRARNRRQDFCVAQRVTLPANLPIDRYILKVTITDEQVKRLAEATIPLELVAQLDPQQQQQQPSQPAKPAGPIAKPNTDASEETRASTDPRTAGFTGRP